MSNKKEKPIWIPLYIADFITATQDLSSLEVGVYTRLLLHYYENGGPINNDLPRLKRVTLAVTQVEQKAFKHVLNTFFEHDEKNSVYVHPRADKEIAHSIEIKAKKSLAGKASAAKRKQQKNQQDGNSCSTAVETELVQSTQQKTNQSQPQSELKKEESKLSSKKKDLANEKATLTDREKRWDLFEDYFELAQRIETLDFEVNEADMRKQFDKFCDWIGAKNPNIKNYQFQWSNWVRQFDCQKHIKPKRSTSGTKDSKLFNAANAIATSEAY